MKTLLISTLAGSALMYGIAFAKAGGAAGSPPPPPPPPVPPAPTFTFDDGLDIPRRAFGGAAGGQTSELALKLAQVPVGKSFIETITVAADVVGDDARLAAFKAQAKTISNRVSGAIRRFRKQDGNASKNFAVRTVSDDKLGFGVRVWREADTSA